MEISVVTSLYKSENYAGDFCKKMIQSIEQFTTDFEIIFVDDCSPDGSKEIIKKYCEIDSRIKLIELSANSGAAAARWEGMNCSKGKYTFLIDADLEEDTNLVKQFYDKITTEVDIDVVFGYLELRKGGLFEKITGRVFYKFFEIFSGIKFIGSPTWARLMSRSYVEALLAYNETHIFAIGIMKIVGFNQVAVPIIKKNKGYSSYSLAGKLTQTLDSVISFSDKPLKFISVLGVFISISAIIFISYIIISNLFFHKFLEGWTSLIAAVVLMGGFNMAAIGIVGLYIGKTFEESKKRPRVSVRNKFNF
jgi:putative glycosyltransferase